LRKDITIARDQDSRVVAKLTKCSIIQTTRHGIQERVKRGRVCDSLYRQSLDLIRRERTKLDTGYTGRDWQRSIHGECATSSTGSQLVVSRYCRVLYSRGIVHRHQVNNSSQKLFLTTIWRYAESSFIRKPRYSVPDFRGPTSGPRASDQISMFMSPSPPAPSKHH